MPAGIAIALAALAVAGCSGDSSGLPKSALSTVVLQLADLSEPFQQFDEGRQGSAETTGAFRTGRRSDVPVAAGPQSRVRAVGRLLRQVAFERRCPRPEHGVDGRCALPGHAVPD